MVLTERNTYGSSRVGLEHVGLEMEYVEYNPQLPLPSPYFVSDEIGDKRYQLSNHLGNVLEVVTDRKLPEDDGTYYENDIFISTTLDNKVDYYTADVVSYSVYSSPYGMVMPNRNESASDYRYGFQDQEMDDEVKGKGNSINYKYRMHDPRVGRFFAVDPLTRKYSDLTPYQFSSNQPIHAKELEGLESSNPLQFPSTPDSDFSETNVNRTLNITSEDDDLYNTLNLEDNLDPFDAEKAIQQFQERLDDLALPKEGDGVEDFNKFEMADDPEGGVNVSSGEGNKAFTIGHIKITEKDIEGEVLNTSEVTYEQPESVMNRRGSYKVEGKPAGEYTTIKLRHEIINDKLEVIKVIEFEFEIFEIDYGEVMAM